MPKIVKVWSHDRRNRQAFVLGDAEDVTVNSVLSRGNEKLKIEGTKIVLEHDGTTIEDDSLVKAFLDHGEIFILLKPNETWESVTKLCNATQPEINAQESNTFPESQIEGEEDNMVIEDNGKIQPGEYSIEINGDVLLNGGNVVENGGNIVSNAENENDTLNDSLDPVINQRIARRQSFEGVWSNFKLDWTKFGKLEVDRLKSGIRCNSLTTYFVNNATTQLRDISKSIPIDVFRRIAEEMVTAYPNSLEDRNDRQERLENGYHTLSGKIKNRNNNLNRNGVEPSLIGSLKLKCNKLKELEMAKAGCVNWQPHLLLPKNVLEEKRISLGVSLREILSAEIETNISIDNEIEGDVNSGNKMENENSTKENHSSEVQVRLEEKILRVTTIFRETFGFQRRFLNNIISPPSAADISIHWPILLHLSFYFLHYELLMDHSLNKLEEEIKRSEAKIFMYGHKQYLSEANTATHEETLKIIAKHFKENHDDLFRNYPEETDPLRVKVPSDVFAWVASINKQDTFYFFIQERLIFSDCTFIRALQVLFASYFIFNKPFPSKNSFTLDFLQRFFLNIHPDKGNKAANPARSKTKVCSFANKISKIRLVGSDETE